MSEIPKPLPEGEETSNRELEFVVDAHSLEHLEPGLQVLFRDEQGWKWKAFSA